MRHFRTKTDSSGKVTFEEYVPPPQMIEPVYEVQANDVTQQLFEQEIKNPAGKAHLLTGALGSLLSHVHREQPLSPFMLKNIPRILEETRGMPGNENTWAEVKELFDKADAFHKTT